MLNRRHRGTEGRREIGRNPAEITIAGCYHAVMVNKIVNVLLIGVALAIVVITVLTLVDFTVDNREAIESEFERRRDQWEDHVISHYRATMVVGGHGSVAIVMMGCSSRVGVEVRRGRVIEYEPIYHTDIPTPSSITGREQCRQHYEALTVDNVFKQVAFYFDDDVYGDSRIGIDIEYDETYGFPVKVSFRARSGHWPYYEINEFEVLP